MGGGLQRRHVLRRERRLLLAASDHQRTHGASLEAQAGGGEMADAEFTLKQLFFH